MKRDTRPVTGWKKIRYRFEVFAAKLLIKIICCFSRRTVRRIGRFLGGIAYRFAGEARRVALENLDIAFGNTKTRAEKERIARASFESGVATLLGLFWMPRLNKDNFQQYIEVDPETVKRVQEIRARGLGVMFITLHYGDWELLGQASAYYGVPVTTVTEQMRNLALREVVDGLREHSGNTMVQQRFATMRLFKALKRGEGVAMLVDLNGIPRFGGAWSDFFGLPVFNNTTAALLALRTGAVVIGGVGYPLPDGRCRFAYGQEITYTVTGDEEADIKLLTQKCSDYCETVVRETPEFWLWSYKRWKFRPHAEQGRYPSYSRHLPNRKTGSER